MTDYYVEVVQDSDGAVVNRMGPMSERRAERVEDGVSRNLNHAEYSTRIVPEPHDAQAKTS